LRGEARLMIPPNWDDRSNPLLCHTAARLGAKCKGTPTSPISGKAGRAAARGEQRLRSLHRERIQRARMARPERLELPTYWFVASRSIQLSYGRAFSSLPARSRLVNRGNRAFMAAGFGLQGTPLEPEGRVSPTRRSRLAGTRGAARLSPPSGGSPGYDS
jgi:hypothetical protein